MPAVQYSARVSLGDLRRRGVRLRLCHELAHVLGAVVVAQHAIVHVRVVRRATVHALVDRRGDRYWKTQVNEPDIQIRKYKYVCIIERFAELPTVLTSDAVMY